MKKIFLSLLFTMAAIFVFAQHPIGNDSFALQTLGSSATLIKSKGAIGSDSGFVTARYADTSAANLGNKLKNYPGALIRVGNKLWMRDSTAQYWIELGTGNGGGSSGIGAVYADYCLIKINDSTLAFDPTCHDSDAYHTVTQIDDSTYILCRPNATCDTIQFAAGGTGSPNSNVGAGYRWAVPNTNNIKTLFAGTNVTIDSVSNANALTISSDDLDAFHTTTQLTDTSFTINRPNGIVDTIIINNLAPLVPEALFTAGYGATAGIPTGATVYYYQITGRSSGLFSTESDVQQATPLSGTLRSLTVVTFATQDPSGSLVITVRKNGVSTGLTVTIPGGSAAGVYTDNTHTVSLSQGDKLDYMGQNNASATATVITSVATIITQ